MEDFTQNFHQNILHFKKGAIFVGLFRIDKESVMEIIAIAGQPREEIGKKGARSVRAENLIPCVMYGGDETVHFSTTLSEVKGLVYTPDFKVAEVEVGGKKYKCILKDLQLHPVKDSVQHIDFLRLIDGHPVKVEVPVRFRGVAAGVKAGGKLLQNLRKVKIKATPERLVDEMMLDVTSLELGQAIRVRNIDPKEGVEILTSPSVPVAVIEIPRALRSATTTAEKGKK